MSALVVGLLATGNSAAKTVPAPIGQTEFLATMDEFPVIMNLAVGTLPRNRVSITGFALDNESLEGCIAYFSGKGVNKTAIILADGTFATTFRRPTNQEFVVTVTVVDADGNVSDPVQVLFPGL
jgi:hypothetical protein